ncbi:O-antigen ligase family protein [Lacisediminihabitans profunda]|uniref:O-antigen ligase-related domain-containing protein n=1 Tax=Lacisediminihabitans profunda TaxID=2594790 RepID=A0A5C8UKC9_9MICO|nr:O-antigen ligase family protein [Lacisediminihabitans profunda]TXN28214.1 hypothetical protein FVP33_17195 [Lacisediminihabitans profunda]
MRRFDWANICRWMITIALGYVMFLPVGHNTILLPSLGLIFAASLTLAIKGRRTIAGPAAIPILIVIAVGVYGSLIGISNPGVANGALVWIVAPILFGTWVWAGDKKLIRMVMFAAVIVTILISVIAVAYVALSMAGIRVPQWIVTQLELNYNGNSFGATAITLYGLSTLVATGPMWLTASLLPQHPLLPKKPLVMVAGALSLLVSLLAGRSALTVVAIVVPVGAWVVWRIYSRRLPRSLRMKIAPLGVVVVVIVGILGAAAVGTNGFTRALKRLISVVTGTGQTISEKIRAEQSDQLVHAWFNSPIFGHGFGATIAGYSREEARPWNFELQYHLILFQVGLLGAVVLAIGVTFAILGLWRAVRMQPAMLAPVLVAAAGAAAMLVANASNPYLQAPGNMWPVYFVLMMLNVSLVPKRNAEGQEPSVPVAAIN